MLEVWRIEPMILVIFEMSLAFNQLSYQGPPISETFFAVQFTYKALEIIKINLY